MSNILVLGAGELGTAILTQLSALSPPSTKITVLLRPQTINSTSPTKIIELTALSSLKISFLAGDVATSSSSELSSLFKPYDLVISCLGFASGPGSQLKITKAVLDAKVKRYVPWQFGVDYEIIGRGSAQDLWDEQLDVRELLKNQQEEGETEWIIVSTGMFTSFLFEPFFGIVDLGSGQERNTDPTVRALGDWENRVTVTTPDDIGRLTSMVIFKEPRVRNQIVFTAGDDLSYGKLAEVVEEVTGLKIKREVWTVDMLKEELKNDPDNAIKKYRVVFSEGKGVSWPLSKTFNVQMGIVVTDVKDWAVKNLLQRLQRS